MGEPERVVGAAVGEGVGQAPQVRGVRALPGPLEDAGDAAHGPSILSGRRGSAAARRQRGRGDMGESKLKPVAGSRATVLPARSP